MTSPLSVSDKINIISIVATTFISLASLYIAMVTLKQNNKMMEGSTRPYVVVYGAVTNFQSPIYKIIVKNFGQSGALITNFETDHDLIDFNFGYGTKRPSENLCGTFIAPNQSFVCAIDYKKILDKEVNKINFRISYEFEDKIYNESIDLNVFAELDILSPRASTTDKELKIISYTLQDMVDKSL